MENKLGFAELVLINVGGKHYQTSIETFSRLPRSCLRQARSSPCQCSAGGMRQIFVDRDPSFFGYILNYYRTGDLHLPKGVCGLALQKELEFWELDENCIAPCCWKTYLDALREIQIRQRIEKELSNDTGIPYQESAGRVRLVRRSRRLVWEFLDDLNSSRFAKIWGAVYHVLLVLSVIVSFIGNFPSFQSDVPYAAYSVTLSSANESRAVHKGNLSLFSVPDTFTDTSVLNLTQSQDINGNDQAMLSDISNNTGMNFILLPRPFLAFRIIDYVCLGFFFMEFIVRFSVCPNKKKLLLTPVTFLDLSYIGSWILMLLILHGFPKTFAEESGYKLYSGLQALAAIRILRIFRLARYFRGLKMILLTLKASARELFLLLICFLIAMVLFADLIRKAEHRLDANSKFDNLFVSLWWVVITMTTVGYGDVVPESPWGYSVGMACAFLGPIITSFIVPMISDHFLSYYAYKERDIRRSQTNHSNKCV